MQKILNKAKIQYFFAPMSSLHERKEFKEALERPDIVSSLYVRSMDCILRAKIFICLFVDIYQMLV